MRDLRGRRLLPARVPGGDRHRQARQGCCRSAHHPAVSGSPLAIATALRRASSAPRAPASAPGRRRAGARRPAGGGGSASCGPRAGRRSSCPVWPPQMPPPAPPRLPLHRCGEGAAAVYMPACINRIFGNAARRARAPDVARGARRASRRGPGCRCGSPTTSPGTAARCHGPRRGTCGGHELHGARAPRAALTRWTDGGRLPVVIDASSCTHGLLAEHAPDGVRGARLDRVGARPAARTSARSRASSSRSPSTRPAPRRTSGSAQKLRAIACADGRRGASCRPRRGCCGMAGDRGWLHPELPASALRDTGGGARAAGPQTRACRATGRARWRLREVTGRPYASFVLLLEELTRE